jgi:hypothetical protein
MIIDLITNSNNNIVVSNYTTTTDALKGLLWRPKVSSDFNLYLDKNVKRFNIQVFIPQTVKDFKEVNIEYTHLGDSTDVILDGVNDISEVYEYSHDGFNWYELPYKTYEDKYYKVVTLDNNSSTIKKYYYSYKFEDLMYIEKCQVAYEDELDPNFLSKSRYLFKYNNTYIYNNFTFCYFRFRLNNLLVRQGEVSIPFNLTKFELYADEKIDTIEEPLLSLTAERYFKQSYFDDNNFIPETSTLFFKLLESNNYIDSNRYMNIHRDSEFNFEVKQITVEDNVKIDGTFYIIPV